MVCFHLSLSGCGTRSLETSTHVIPMPESHINFSNKFLLLNCPKTHQKHENVVISGMCRLKGNENVVISDMCKQCVDYFGIYKNGLEYEEGIYLQKKALILQKKSAVLGPRPLYDFGCTKIKKKTKLAV